jgi:hypothetical protein
MKKIIYGLLLVISFLAYTRSVCAQKTPRHFLLIGIVPPLTKLSNGHLSYPGHSFVGYGIQDIHGCDSIIEYCGVHPDQDYPLGLFHKKRRHARPFMVDGHLSNTDSLYGRSDKARVFRYAISELSFKQALDIKEQWKTCKEYEINHKDCVNFLDEICKTILHLDTPKRTLFSNLFPSQYIQKMVRKNPELLFSEIKK